MRWLCLEVPVPLHWAQKELRHYLDWISIFCMAKETASVEKKKKALINLGYWSWEYYSSQSISFYLYASLSIYIYTHFFVVCFVFITWSYFLISEWNNSHEKAGLHLIPKSSLGEDCFLKEFSARKTKIKYCPSALYSVLARVFLMEVEVLS